ncbi:energy transducer TonB [Novosphingobium sp.]|uniref:energy transducer TonB n=1 Tax=Novosphingobium sp. TaxID=1874826 RepID=UPI0025EE3F59|nr:energy transducer TonB [Novosphingobium sp.]
MAYADQQVSGNRTIAFVVVALIHLALIYALVTGLAYEGIQAVVKKVTTVDIKKDEPKKEPPPPPKQKAAAPPIVAPPVKINVNVAPPPITTVTTPPPVAPIVPIIAPPAPVPAPPPPPPRFQAKSASPKGNPGSWANANDYPSGPLRREEEGVTRFRVTIGADGRVTSCDVTGSSGSSELDSTTCSLITRRGRFNPAMDGEGKPVAGGWASSVRWQIPKD